MAQLLIDLRGKTLAEDERQWLAHPACAGLILFSRNYDNPAQLQALVAARRQPAGKPILVTVDHEGGRVQRFRDDFTRLPAAGSLLAKAGGNLAVARYLAWCCGLVMAAELVALGVDLSFAPVLDLGVNQSVIGDRAFGADLATVIALSRAYAQGMAAAGMANVAKHYPGHGQVLEDTHLHQAIDSRSLDAIAALDEVPFRALISDKTLDAVMPAHVIYPALDDKPASSSRRWLTERLRGELGFAGLIFSDDLSMKGAHSLGTPAERAKAASLAGCDLLLCCNDPANHPPILAALADSAPVALGALAARAGQVSADTLARAQALLVSITRPPV
ncbi:beta-N-acetylhexosaminidase [Gallaecimonas xiamenensis]|uniref:beta-N-acetylhexosaminidase n=1 Tax=Gallaecimonas xiamenensis 3-C-1 TaxID=745411 RepID=K2J8A9_9GAMM|nr:beta-N-acetylhexosaminidase [Gallaecimonas xiamenensis]EKE71072.1 glycoside hydrolase family 3 [Gallaecimonas xiamenensis 3-C-1]